MDGMLMEWRTQGRLEPMWCDTWLRRETRTQNSAQMCSLIHVAHVVLCVLVLVGVRRVTVVIVHIGHDEVLVVIQILRSYFCRDFLYQEMYSLHEGELVLVVRNYFGTLKICNLEPRVFTWWNVIILSSMCCDTLCAPVHAVWAGVLFTHPVGCLEVFFQSTETGPNSEKKSRTVRPWRMLRIPTARLVIVSIPICWRGRSCRQVTLQFPQTLVLFAVFFVDCEEWFKSLVESLPCVRRAISCSLFSLEQSQTLSAFVTTYSPWQFCQIALYPSRSTQWVVVVPSCKYGWMASVLFLTSFLQHLSSLVVHSLSFRRSMFGMRLLFFSIT